MHVIKVWKAHSLRLRRQDCTENHGRRSRDRVLCDWMGSNQHEETTTAFIDYSLTLSKQSPISLRGLLNKRVCQTSSFKSIEICSILVNKFYLVSILCHIDCWRNVACKEYDHFYVNCGAPNSTSLRSIRLTWVGLVSLTSLALLAPLAKRGWSPCKLYLTRVWKERLTGLCRS